MWRAVDADFKIDEVKEIRDRALALQIYAREALNPEPERQACAVPLRAERKAGELLAKMEKAKRGPDKETGQRSQSTTPAAPLLVDLGISR